MEKQVDKQAYNFLKYCHLERFASYWQQLYEVFQLKPTNILEVGVGDMVFASYIKNNSNIVYKSLDIAEDLNPDILGSVDKIPIPDNQFDLVCAFEVLEHLPFDRFQIALGEIHRVTKEYVLISLPHWGRHFSWQIRLPFFKKIRWQYKFSFPHLKHKFNGQHYWEIGKSGYELNKIKKIIESVGFQIRKDYILFDSPYHHFFVLIKK